jgi:hypothetical protein
VGTGRWREGFGGLVVARAGGEDFRWVVFALRMCLLLLSLKAWMDELRGLDG